MMSEMDGLRARGAGGDCLMAGLMLMMAGAAPKQKSARRTSLCRIDPTKIPQRILPKRSFRLSFFKELAAIFCEAERDVNELSQQFRARARQERVGTRRAATFITLLNSIHLRSE
jgi:hypothetical protein